MRLRYYLTVHFKPVASALQPPDSPLLLFDELPRMAGAVPELWRQQGDILREYRRSFVDTTDVAVELPTGTGKTIVGLLIGEWRRRRGEQVVYACPTRQLAHQVAAVAKTEGIPAVTLVGTWRDWPPVDRSRYESGDAVAITTYNTVFNVSPKIGTPGTLLFDDAHSGEQYVAESWSVAVNRFEHQETWVTLIDALSPAMDGMFRQRLLDADGDPNLWNDVRLIVPSRRPGMVEKIDQALALLPDGNEQSYRRSMIRGGLASCLVYVGWREVLIRPFIPPTSENEPFKAAVQRIYLSATLGRGGELERAFGRTSIQRLPLPEDAQHPRSGRRFFIFNDLTTGDPTTILRRVVQAAGKALILAPSHSAAQDIASECSPSGWQILTKDDVTTGLTAFTQATNTILALAGRYDGLDLPGDACRLVVLDSLPDGAHLQERFLASRVNADTVLEERIRTRVVQGAGRCTRGPSDHAIVVLRGADLAGYLSNPNRRATLDPDLQAEIEFGLENSRSESADDIAEAVDVFLTQGNQWRTEAEPSLVAARRASQQRDPDGSASLATSAPFEVAACQAAWRSNYPSALRAAQQAAQALSGDGTVRTYRGLWLYLASVWAFAAVHNEPGVMTTASGLRKQAADASWDTTWLPETEPGDHSVDINADDTPAVRTIAAQLENGTRHRKIEQQLERMIAGLAAVEAPKVEPALAELGRLLGADASKPGGQAQCDSAWCWDKRIWLTLEAKTEHRADGEIAVKDVRQAGPQLRSLGAGRGVDAPETSASIIISPRTEISPDASAAAENHVHLIHPDKVRGLAADVQSAWNELLTRRPGHSGPELQGLVRRIFSEHHVLPTQVRERLTVFPIRK